MVFQSRHFKPRCLVWCTMARTDSIGYLLDEKCTKVYYNHIQKELVVPCHVEQKLWPLRSASWHKPT